MKIRSGFVSNSSSSSFIIGVVGIDEAAAEEFRALGINKRPYGDEYLMSLEEVEEELKQCYGAVDRCWNEDNIEVSSFDSTTVVCKNYKEHSHFVVLSNGGQEPQYDEDSWEYNYDDVDMTSEWFDEDSLKVAEFIEKHGGEVSVGGGFNG